MKRKLVVRRQPVVQLQQAAVLRESRIGRTLAENVRAYAQKSIDSRMRVEAAARTQSVAAMRSQVDQRRQVFSAESHQRISAEAVVGAVVMRTDLAVDFGLAAGGEERRLRNELDAAADRVAAELSAVRAANHLYRAEVAGVVEIEERVDAAARRRRRKAYP